VVVSLEDLADADPAQVRESIDRLLGVAHTRATIAPSVRLLRRTTDPQIWQKSRKSALIIATVGRPPRDTRRWVGIHVQHGAIRTTEMLLR